MRLQDLQPASFKGVRFLVPKDQAEEGRNAIPHDYPDASFRYVEDNGKITPLFSINAILHGPDVAAQFRRLRAALTRPGPGTLKHPYYGSQFCMVDGTFRVDRKDQECGILRLDIPFIVTGPPSLPGAVGAIPAVVSGLAATFVRALFARFSKTYGNPLSSASRLTLTEAYKDIGTSLVTTFGNAAFEGGCVCDEAPLLSMSADRAGSLLEKAIRAPFETTLSEDVLLRGYEDVLATARGLHSDASDINPTTQDLAHRQQMLALLASTVEAAAFAGLAEAMVSKLHKTADEVSDDESALTEAYGLLQSIDLGSDLQNDLRDLYIATSEVLSEAETRLPRTTELAIENTPASVLAYSLYDDDARLDRLVTLNLFANPLLLSGDVSVLVDG